jgi:hypothetical protein
MEFDCQFLIGFCDSAFRRITGDTEDGVVILHFRDKSRCDGLVDDWEKMSFRRACIWVSRYVAALS